MAYHLHRQIREAIETALTGLTTSGTRVYANRLMPMADANLPGIRIYADEEEASTVSIHGPRLVERRLSVVVECCAKHANFLDDTLDQMSKEVELALASGITVSGMNLPVVYVGMSFDDDLSDKPVGVKRLRFSIEYLAMSNAPDVLS